MADDNRPLQYLRYAIGEIILVVIGILIALQINNWNDHRKSDLRKNALLKALRTEFNLNLKQLEEVISYDQRVIKSTGRILHLPSDDPVLQFTDSLRVLLQNTSWLWTFDPQNGALRSGMSSGDIHLIQNDSLVNLLFSWQDVVADAKENEDRSIDLRLQGKTVIDRFVRSIDYRSMEHPDLGKSKTPSDYRALLNDPLFEDYISERHTFTEEAVLELELVKKNNQKILELLELELEKTDDLSK